MAGRGEFAQGEIRFFLRALAGPVVEDEAVAVGGEDEGDVEGFGVVEGLLDAGADAAVIVFRLDHRDGDVGFVVEDVVGAFGLASGDEFAADDDTAFGEADFLAELGDLVPAGLPDGGGDELGADVAFAEVLFVEWVWIASECRGGATHELLRLDERKLSFCGTIVSFQPYQTIRGFIIGRLGISASRFDGCSSSLGRAMCCGSGS